MNMGKPRKKPSITGEMLKSMAREMATRAYYDKADWITNNTPLYENTQVEKALRKWFKVIEVEVRE